jgi:serine/threonine protein kinase
MIIKAFDEKDKKMIRKFMMMFLEFMETIKNKIFIEKNYTIGTEYKMIKEDERNNINVIRNLEKNSIIKIFHLKTIDDLFDLNLEMIIHIILYLKTKSTSFYVPKIYRIFHKFGKKEEYINNVEEDDDDKYLNIIIQVCFMIYKLQKINNFAHRDMHDHNIMINYVPRKKVKYYYKYSYDEYMMTSKSNFFDKKRKTGSFMFDNFGIEIKIIDFGFAHVGNDVCNDGFYPMVTKLNRSNDITLFFLLCPGLGEEEGDWSRDVKNYVLNKIIEKHPKIYSKERGKRYTIISKEDNPNGYPENVLHFINNMLNE